MKTKHTPRPWRAKGIQRRPGRVGSFGLADARLIAAAPDLLDALRDAVSQIEYLRSHLSPKGRYLTTPTTEETLREIRAAIARAEGKE